MHAQHNGILLSQKKESVQSVQLLSCVRLFATHELQHARPPYPSPTPRVRPNPCPLYWWCHPTISSSVVPFSSCPQSFPASGSFQMSQLFASGGQSIGVSFSTSVFPNDEYAGLISFIETHKIRWDDSFNSGLLF